MGSEHTSGSALRVRDGHETGGSEEPVALDEVDYDEVIGCSHNLFSAVRGSEMLQSTHIVP